VVVLESDFGDDGGGDDFFGAVFLALEAFGKEGSAACLAALLRVADFVVVVSTAVSSSACFAFAARGAMMLV